VTTSDAAGTPNRPALAALVVGALSVPGALTYVLGLVGGMAAVLLGFVGVARSRQLDARGEGMAVAGIILGMLGMALPVAMSLFLAD
jgi:hypothetical protein